MITVFVHSPVLAGEGAPTRRRLKALDVTEQRGKCGYDIVVTPTLELIAIPVIYLQQVAVCHVACIVL